MKSKLLMKSLLVAAGLCVGAMSSWAVDVPTPVYKLTFDDASTVADFGGTIVGSSPLGELVNSADARFGKYYQNLPNASGAPIRTNYLKIVPATNPWTALYSAITTGDTPTNAFTISMWVNTKIGNSSNLDGYWSPLMIACKDNEGTISQHPFGPQLLAFGGIHINSNGWIDYQMDDAGDPNDDTAGSAIYTSGLATEGWHHIVWVFSELNTTTFGYKIYVDGESKFSKNLTFNGTSALGMLENLNCIVLGSTASAAYWDWSDNAFAYDDIAIYPAALSSEQISQIITDKNKYTYTVNAVAGDLILQELASGSTLNTLNYTANAPKVIVKDNKYYVLSDGQDGMDGFLATYTMGEENVVKNIYYTLDESIVYFSEADDFNSLSKTALATASGGYYCDYYSTPMDIKLTSIGVYQLETNVISRDSKSSLEVYTESGTASVALIGKNSGLGIKTVNFIATDDMRVGGPYYDNKFQNSKGVDYVLIRKLYDVVNPSNIVGDVNYSSTSGTSSNYTLKKGETKVFSFQNHGQDYGNNWRINVIEDDIWKSVTRADSWDEKGGNAGTGAATKVSYQVSKDGGNTKVNLDWDEYKADMADARVVATLAYGLDGTLAITTTSTGAANGYIYYVDQDVTGLTSELTINLSVYNSWLEVLSVEQTSVGGTIASSGYSSLASAFGLDFANVTALTAYVVTNTTNDAVTLTSVDELPANSGVILKGTGSAAYSIPVKADAAYNGTNLLSAAVTATSITANSAYILQGGQFHLVTANSEVPAGKAYLLASNVPYPARALGFMFSDEVEGISAVSLDKQNGEFYNLQGQRVDSPKKGLYIVNGTKVIIK